MKNDFVAPAEAGAQLLPASRMDPCLRRDDFVCGLMYCKLKLLYFSCVGPEGAYMDIRAKQRPLFYC